MAGSRRGAAPRIRQSGQVRILALDPGTKQSGYVIYDADVRRVVHSGVLDNGAILLAVHQWEVDLLAIEMIASYGMAVGREVFETCVWIGRFMQAAPGNVPVRRVFRKDVKMHLCGTTRAKDANVWQALVDRFGPPGTKQAPGVLYGVKSHARAALAVAVTAAET